VDEAPLVRESPGGEQTTMGSIEEKGGEVASDESAQKREKEQQDNGIVAQVEYYLSESNLKRDLFLKSKMSSDLWVSLKIIADFPKMKAMGATDVQELAKLLSKKSTDLQVNEATLEVRPTKRSTLMLREVPDSTTESEIQEFFNSLSECPPIHSINPDVQNTWFVTFDTEDGARKAHELTKSLTFKDVAVKARVIPPRRGPTNMPDTNVRAPAAAGYYPQGTFYPQMGMQPGPFVDPNMQPIPAVAIVPPQQQRRNTNRNSQGGPSGQNHRTSTTPARMGNAGMGMPGERLSPVGVPPSTYAPVQAMRGSPGGPGTSGGNSNNIGPGPGGPGPRMPRGANNMKNMRGKQKKKPGSDAGDGRSPDRQGIEKGKPDVNFSTMNFPPLRNEDGGKDAGIKEDKEAVDLPRPSSADKASAESEETSPAAEDDKQMSRSSSESGANGIAKTYASIVIRARANKPPPSRESPKITPPTARTPPSQGVDGPSGDADGRADVDTTASAEVAPTSPAAGSLRVDATERENKTSAGPSFALQNSSADDKSAAHREESGSPAAGEEKEADRMSSSGGTLTHNSSGSRNRIPSVWSKLPKSVREAPSKSPAAPQGTSTSPPTTLRQ